MLLEYTVDTKDEKMTKKAIQLRQNVSGRKIQEAVAAEAVSSNDLLVFKQMNRKERHEHFTEEMSIINAFQQERMTLDRANQQLSVDARVKMLDRHLASALTRTKCATDVMNTLEDRIKAMRAQLKDPSNPPIEKVISKSLQKDDRQELKSTHGQCTCCGKTVFIALLPAHIVDCERRRAARSPPKISLDPGARAGVKHLSERLTEEQERELEETLYARLPVYDVEQTVLTALATFPPQKPRECKVVSKGTTYIDWEWLPPVIDGGLAVTDYEISYLGRHELYDKQRGRYRRWEDEGSTRTSRFCFRHDAIAHTGFRLDGLRAGSEYTNFRIRCCNLRGWSEWADMLHEEDNPLQKLLNAQAKVASSGEDGVFHLEAQQGGGGRMGDDASSVGTAKGSLAETDAERRLRLRLAVGRTVTTLEPEPPTAPLFVNCSRCSSTCIYLDWSAPFYDGGVPVVDYIVHYTVREVQTTVTARNVVLEHVLKFNIGSGTTTTGVIRNLPPDTEVVRIYLVAVNEVGLVGPKGELKQKVCRTAESSRHGQLTRELAAAAAATGPYFDSDFYTGVRQRLNRVEHMKQLTEELALTPGDWEEEEEQKQWAAIQERRAIKLREEEAEKKRKEELNLSDQEDELDRQEAELADKTQSFLFTMRQRRQHFKRKIFALEKRIRDLKRERQDIDAFRTKCTLEMRHKEAELRAYKLESERLRQYVGATVTSSVLAGFTMQYRTEDYVRRIEQAHSTTMEEIANIKFKVISGENRRIQAKTELEAAEEGLKERTARFHEFEREYQRRRRVLGRMSGTEDDSAQLYARYFKLLQEHTLQRKGFRRKVGDLFLGVITRYLRGAFDKWRYGEFRALSSHDTALFASKGGVMLAQAAEKRAELQNLLREAISGTAAIKQKIDMAGLSRSRQQRLAASQDFKGMEEGIDHTDLYHVRGLKMLYEGDGYAKMNKFGLARDLYEAQIMWIRSRPQVDIKILGICHGRLGKMFLSLGKQNRAIVEFDRQLSLAKEIADKPEEADAYYGLGAGYLANYDYENAVRYLNIAQTLLNGLGSAAKYSGALRALQDCYERMDRRDKAQVCADRITEIESELSEKIALANFKISDMKGRLVHTAAEIEHVVQIERTTFRAMELRALIHRTEALLETLEAELAEQQTHCGALAMLLDAIEKEEAEAARCDEPEMWSALVHDQPQIVELEELKVRLAARKKNEVANLEREQEAVKVLQVRIKNAENDIAGADEQLALEEGALMKHSRLDKPFRSVGLCAANAAGNEVTGTGTGGFEEFAAAEGMHIHMIDYHSGAVSHVYMGGSEDLGHTGVVTCVLHDGKLVFSGSTDETIIAWDTSEARKRVRTYVGHEGSIVSLAVEGQLLASGGSDSTLRLWDKHTGQQLRIVYGHSRSVLSVEIGPTWMLTGSTDTEVRVWKIGKTKRGSLAVDCVYRLIGHEAAVTCVRFGQMEVLSGDVNGRILVWWMKTGQILRRCQVHSSPVKCMQFDSIHIVSGGADHCVCITDIATGEVMQTLRGHTLGVIALAFDSERIVSVSGDNTVRYWTWGRSSAPTDKLHVLEKGETLQSVAQRYSLSLGELMRWNGISDVRQCFAGMTLIVRKADPDAPTEAEKLLLQRERRMEGGARLAERAHKDSAVSDAMLQEGAKLFKYDRVHKLATDIDFFSLGNRLFGAQKRQLELFPDALDPNVNTRSLAGRLRADEERRREEARTAERGISDFEALARQGADNGEDAAALAWALKTGSKVRPRYFVSADNEDEWSHVAEGLAVTMLQMLVEYEAYDIVMEQKRILRSKQSVIGRINTRQQEEERERQSGMAVVSGGDGAVLAHGGADIVPADIVVAGEEGAGASNGQPAPFLPSLQKMGTASTVAGADRSRPPSREQQARARKERKAAELARRKEAIKRSITGGRREKRSKSPDKRRGDENHERIADGAVGGEGPSAGDRDSDVAYAPTETEGIRLPPINSARK